MELARELIIIPDIHGRTFWKDAIPDIQDGAPVVFLGDYLDPYDYEGITPEMALANFKEILEVTKDDEGEDDLSAALRELKEETSLILESKDLQDLGIHEYLRHKDIHIFLYRVSSLPDTSSLECTSTFEAFGKHIKEIDGFRHIPIVERSRFSRSIQTILQKVIVD